LRPKAALGIPEHIALQLKLEINNQREVTTADGRKQMVPYVGPIEVFLKTEIALLAR